MECLSLTVPEEALEAYEAALASVCETVAFFRDHATGSWRLEGVRTAGAKENELTGALALAAAVTGVTSVLEQEPTEVDGWLERTKAAFPEQLIGRSFAIRGTHLTGVDRPGRTTLILDAGVAFGSGEHNSTRGCLIALEQVIARTRHSPGRRPRRILDLGTGSGILAMAAAKTSHRKVLATDIEPWSVRVARENARLNHVHRLVLPILADGWQSAAVRNSGPYDLVFGNILARPLRAMARDLSRNLAPGGTAILAGLLRAQARDVLAAHRRTGLVLEQMIDMEPWTTLVLRRTG
ncbi:MAG: 50S ribosomal protein L11 methyltransferase [Acetobacteraceae bacterium]